MGRTRTQHSAYTPRRTGGRVLTGCWDREWGSAGWEPHLHQGAGGAQRKGIWVGEDVGNPAKECPEAGLSIGAGYQPPGRGWKPTVSLRVRLI